MLSDYKSDRTGMSHRNHRKHRKGFVVYCFGDFYCFCDFCAFCVTFVLAAGGRATARPYGASGFLLMNGILLADSIKQ